MALQLCLYILVHSFAVPLQNNDVKWFCGELDLTTLNFPLPIRP